MTTAADVKQAFSEAIAENLPAIAAAVWAFKIGGGNTAEDLQQNTRYYAADAVWGYKIGGGLSAEDLQQNTRYYTIENLVASAEFKAILAAAVAATKTV